MRKRYFLPRRIQAAIRDFRLIFPPLTKKDQDLVEGHFYFALRAATRITFRRRDGDVEVDQDSIPRLCSGRFAGVNSIPSPDCAVKNTDAYAADGSAVLLLHGWFAF
jgi:hypothetical protein